MYPNQDSTVFVIRRHIPAEAEFQALPWLFVLLILRAASERAKRAVEPHC